MPFLSGPFVRGFREARQRTRSVIYGVSQKFSSAQIGPTPTHHIRRLAQLSPSTTGIDITSTVRASDDLLLRLADAIVALRGRGYFMLISCSMEDSPRPQSFQVRLQVKREWSYSNSTGL